MQDTREELGRRLRQLRIERALTQAELAVSSGVGKATIARVESGVVVPQLRTVRSMATALDVSPQTLTHGLEALWATA
ncbi:helix-turn-helix domain-containing protein [Blastococcus goldschmidtiae]|uniref:Helix-turn-helix transcriptional regulator n=1 Tax=Blastococcus goldschmidtiae TaxID=3075546 RepID=A0ABU2K7C5_9ACTN|nr:helix-turn-helix transcriptional regulator [Blastococcus sp. DSM 46792]MDT0276073.1 helix-turn-helix transcriptional regulator [Blastococcus sp. DSM 46792]